MPTVHAVCTAAVLLCCDCAAETGSHHGLRPSHNVSADRLKNGHRASVSDIRHNRSLYLFIATGPDGHVRDVMLSAQGQVEPPMLLW